MFAPLLDSVHASLTVKLSWRGGINRVQVLSTKFAHARILGRNALRHVELGMESTRKYGDCKCEKLQAFPTRDNEINIIYTYYIHQSLTCR